MKDIVIDTNILAQLLFQYFSSFKTRGCFEPNGVLANNRTKYINSIISRYLTDFGVNFVIASSFAFIEIARKFDEIVRNRFTLYQFKRFLNEPPEWFLIAPVDSSLFLNLAQIPAYVTLPNGDIKSIEWADAIHLATAMSRDEWLFATTDSRIIQLNTFDIFKNNFI